MFLKKKKIEKSAQWKAFPAFWKKAGKNLSLFLQKSLMQVNLLVFMKPSGA